MKKAMRSLTAGVCITCACAAGIPAQAAVVGSTTDVDFTGSSVTFGFGGPTFTLTDTSGGSFTFDPVSISTQGTAMVNSLALFGPAQPTSYFDPVRGSGILVFDDSFQYTAFPDATVIRSSAGPTFIGLKLTLSDGDHFGYAQFAGTFLDSYAFESIAGVGIQAGSPIAPVPEPATYALMLAGLAITTFAVRRRRALPGAIAAA